MTTIALGLNIQGELEQTVLGVRKSCSGEASQSRDRQIRIGLAERPSGVNRQYAMKGCLLYPRSGHVQ